MKFAVHRVEAADWDAMLSDEAHVACFDQRMPPGFDRIHYALLAVDEVKNTPVAFMTVREVDAEGVYLKYGGAFPPIAGSVMVWHVYKAFVDYIGERYKHIHTLVKNDNIPYLKLAMKAGLLIVGVKNYQGEIFLDLFMERAK